MQRKLPMTFGICLVVVHNLGQSAVLLSYVVRLSVRLSVTLVICGHISWVSSKVITVITVALINLLH